MNDKLARAGSFWLDRVARSPLTSLMPDVLASAFSIARSSGADSMGLIVAMMSGFAGVYAPSAARRVEAALTELARELEALDPEARASAELREEEFLHLVRDLIVHTGRMPELEDRARLRGVLMYGLRERHASARTRVFFDLATRLRSAEVETLRSLLRASSDDALATTVDALALALLEREGLVAKGTVSALGLQFLRWCGDR